MKLDKSLMKLLENNEHATPKMSRRDALKFMGISPIAAGIIAQGTSGSITEAKASGAKGKIVIVGGGSGAIMAAARLEREDQAGHAAADDQEVVLLSHLRSPPAGRAGREAPLLGHRDT